jgi:hypothetical protein
MHVWMRIKMAEPIENLKRHIEFLDSLYILAEPHKRDDIMKDKVKSQGMLDRMENKKK